LMVSTGLGPADLERASATTQGSEIPRTPSFLVPPPPLNPGNRHANPATAA
jgi:hypothetical protein